MVIVPVMYYLLSLLIIYFLRVSQCLFSFVDEARSKSFRQLSKMCRIIDTNVKNELTALRI